MSNNITFSSSLDFQPGMNCENMGKLLGLDIGEKKIGLAITDDMQMIASPLKAVSAADLYNTLEELVAENNIEKFIIGEPKTLLGGKTDGSSFVQSFCDKAKNQFPAIEQVLVDERFTSGLAQQAMLDGGMKKSKRKVKENVDIIAACLILQSYLEQKRWQ